MRLPRLVRSRRRQLQTGVPTNQLSTRRSRRQMSMARKSNRLRVKVNASRRLARSSKRLRSSPAPANRNSIGKSGEVLVASATAFVALAGVIVAAKSAADAAKAAQDSIELTREMSQLAQRAWVGVVEIKGEPTVGQPFRVFVTIRNSGATFAKGVRVATYFVSKDDGTLPNYAKADQMEGIQGTGRHSFAADCLLRHLRR